MFQLGSAAAGDGASPQCHAILWQVCVLLASSGAGYATWMLVWYSLCPLLLPPVSLCYRHNIGQRGVPQNKAQLHRRANSWLHPQQYCVLRLKKRCIYTSVSQGGSGTFPEVVVGSEWTVSEWSIKNGHMYLWKLPRLMFPSQGWQLLVMAAYRIRQNSSQKNIPCLSQPFILALPLILTHTWIPVRGEHSLFKIRGSTTTCENCCLKDSSVCCW